MIFGTEIPQDESARAGLLDRMTLPWTTSLGASAENAFVHNPLTSLWDASKLFLAQHPGARTAFANIGLADAGLPLIDQNAPDTDPADQFQDPKDLNAKYGQSLGLTFDQPTRAGAVSILVRRKQEEIDRNAYLNRQPGGFTFGAANFATNLAVSATDPLNIASAFIPVVGEARAAIWAERYGSTAARFMTGAVEGAAGAAAVEPINYGAAKYLGDDYDMGDSLMNVAVGGALGGGLHVGFGAISDRLNRAAPETREATLRGAVANMAEGRDVEIDHILATDPRFNAPDHEPERGPFDDAPSMEPSQVQIDQATADLGGLKGALPKEPSLFQTIKDLGGVALHDAGGNLTREGGEIRAVLQDVRRPGLVNKNGRTPDYLREALQERGWFGTAVGHGEKPGDDLQHLYDLMRQEAQGQKVFHPESETSALVAQRRDLQQQLDFAGVTADDRPEVAAQKLAKWRADQDEAAGSALNYWRSRADEMGVEYRQTDTPEDVMASVVEARAIRAERMGDLAAFADDAEARLIEHLDRLYPDLKDEELERDLQAIREREPAGEPAPEGFEAWPDGRPEGGSGQHGAGAGAGRVGAPQDAAAALDRARTASLEYGRDRQASSATISPEASAAADKAVRAARGDDLDTELQEAMAAVDAFEKQGALTPEEAEAARAGNDGIQKANRDGEAARAAARCLLLHP